MADVLPLDIAVRLAAEGVPVRAIARAIDVPSSELWKQLNQARLTGRMHAIPREEWPSPDPLQRSIDPAWVAFERLDEQSLISATMRTFHLTTAQARLMLILMRSSEILEHDQLHELYSDSVTRSNIKVQICKMRPRLEPLKLEITTHWGRGYGMAPEHRVRAMGLLFREFETELTCRP